MQVIAGCLWLVAPGWAADVVWLNETDDATRALVAEAAGGRTLEPLDLRAAATAWSQADDDAYANLEASLKAVREFEQKLDGELVIMQDLGAPLLGVGVVRDGADRDRLFAALAYQGFAVNRFFDVDLGTDPHAAAYRMELNGVWVERPWMDAVALDPDRDVTAYDIAEAPQRVAYAKVKDQVRAALPASLIPEQLPADAGLVVDGRPTELGPAGNLRLVPGRHLVHAVLDGRIVARWDVTLAPGQSAKGTVPITDDLWNGWLAALAEDAPVPSPIGESIEALGGTVWLARDEGDKVPVVFAATPSGISAVEIQRSGSRGGSESEGGPSLVISGSGGWLSSGNFYTQDPSTPNEAATVNALTGGAGIGIEVDAGQIRFGGGLTADVTLGEHHVARFGADGETRVRTMPYVSAGVPIAQLGLGYLFPHHPAARLQLAVPVGAGLEVRGAYTLGLGIDGTLQSGDPWDNLPVFAANAGIGYRFGL